MPTFFSLPFVSAAFGGAIPSLPLAFPAGLELAALVPVGFATGLLAALFHAMRVNRENERRARVSRVPAQSPA